MIHMRNSFSKFNTRNNKIKTPTFKHLETNETITFGFKPHLKRELCFHTGGRKIKFKV